MMYANQIIENQHQVTRRILILATLAMVLQLPAFAQVNYQQQYAAAKGFFKEGKYSLAMEVFKTVIVKNNDNPFSEYASFYYALSAYNQGYKSVARDMLLQVKSQHPGWDQIDEVNLWLVKIHFDNHEYFQGMRLFGGMKDNRIKRDGRQLLKAAVDSINDVETLKKLSELYPEDEIVGTQYAKILSQNRSIIGSEETLQMLIDRFRLKKSDYIEETPKSFFKDQYAISVLFPFVIKSLDPAPTRKRNQSVLDLYQGMKLAIDTLETMGVKIDLRAYDTERSTRRTKAILELDELKSSDLIVSPLFMEMNALVQDFSYQHKINTFNPVTNNYDMIAGNPYGFLFQPSNEIIGQKSAEFVASNTKNKRCIVFYGESIQDSVMAANFIVKAKEMELEIMMAPMITKENTKKILDILQTATEFDDLKYPTQFTLPKDTVDCIFVASNDPLIYAKVIGSVETRGDSILIVGSESWLDQQSIDYEKYRSLGVVLHAPMFAKTSNPWYKAFQKSFIRRHGRISSTLPYTDYARVGYDFMLFVGNALQKHGVYFQEGLKDEIMPGYVSQGYDFRDGQVNQNVPFIRVNQFGWEVIEYSNDPESKK